MPATAAPYQLTRLSVRAAAAVSFSLASGALLAWIRGAHLPFPFHSPIMMKSNTAVGIIALSIGVFLCTWPRSRVRDFISTALAVFVCVLGVLTFSQHVVGWNLHIDQLLFTEPPGQIATASPNRMGPPSAISLAVLGFTLACVPRLRAGRGNILWLAFLAMILALVPLAGHLFGAQELYTLAQLTGIAPQTALLLIILSVSILLLRPDLAPMNLFYQQDAGGEMARRLIPAALVLPPLAGILISEARDLELVDIPMGRVLLQASLITPLVIMIWVTARRLSRIAQEHDRARRDVEVVRAEVEGLAQKNVETTNLLDRLLDNAPVGFAVFDRQQRCVRVNRFAAATSEVPIDSHVGRTLRELHPEQADTFEPLIARVFNTGLSIERFEITLETGHSSDGARTYGCELFPVPDQRDVISLVGMVIVDVTERKRLDEQRAALLESERAARAEAERAGLLKDEFLATLSHELRTPLTSIVGWSQILRRKTPEPHDLARGLETIDRNSKSLSQLINDLLDVSRIINGKLRLNTILLHIQSVADAAFDSVAPSAETKGVTLVREIDAEPLAVNADPSRLQQVIWNLLSNAVKFTPRGGSVRLAVRRVEDQVEVVVSDTGIGVKPEFLPHMFQRFRQADASTTRRFGGLGLGLSIVRQLTELHGGSVRVASDGVDRGTTFTISLPLAPTSERVANSAHPGTIFTYDPLLLEGIRVLVVDDEADARNLIARVIEQSGAIVSTAASADEGLLRVELDLPRVLISDIGMPDKDGYEFIRQLRTRRSEAELPAVALTAFARPEDRDRSMRAGFQLHIRKPVDPQELVHAIATLTRPRAPVV